MQASSTTSTDPVARPLPWSMSWVSRAIVVLSMGGREAPDHICLFGTDPCLSGERLVDPAAGRRAVSDPRRSTASETTRASSVSISGVE
jgi:hypothetical protein